MLVSSVFSRFTEQSDTPDQAQMTTSVVAWVAGRRIEVRET